MAHRLQRCSSGCEARIVFICYWKWTSTVSFFQYPTTDNGSHNVLAIGCRAAITLIRSADTCVLQRKKIPRTMIYHQADQNQAGQIYLKRAEMSNVPLPIMRQYLKFN